MSAFAKLTALAEAAENDAPRWPAKDDFFLVGALIIHGKNVDRLCVYVSGNRAARDVRARAAVLVRARPGGEGLWASLCAPPEIGSTAHIALWGALLELGQAAGLG